MLGSANNSEQAVLGCLMLYPQKFGIIRQILKADDFNFHHHVSLFEAYEYYHSQGLEADITLLKDYFTKTEVEMDYSYLSSLTEAFVFETNLIAYCKTVKEDSLRRSFERMLLEVQQNLEDDEFKKKKTKDLVSELMTSALKIDTFREDRFSMDQALDHFVDNLRSKKSLVSMGYPPLDSITGGGIYRHGLITIASDSGSGKTVFACNMTVLKALLGEKVLFINLEIPVIDMIEIMAAIMSDKENSMDYQTLIESNEEDLEQIEGYVRDKLRELQIYFARDCYSIEEIIAQVDLHRIDHHIDSVFIDHGQLIENAEEYSKYVGITKELKRYVLKHETPIFLLSQLNDNKEKRADKEPRKSDLRGGANLYQDSDIVMFLYRLDPDDDQVYLKLAKNRKGASGKAIYYRLDFKAESRQVELIRLASKPEPVKEEKEEPKYAKRKVKKRAYEEQENPDDY